MRTIRTMLTTLIDYAGLFPPAALGMDDAVRRYASYLGGCNAWMLGRFIVPLTGLGEFARASEGHLPTEPDAEPWHLSALVKAGSAREVGSAIDRIFAFNAEREEEPGLGGAVIDTIEVRVPSVDAAGSRFCDEVMEIVPEQIEAYFELPLAHDVRGVVASLAGTGGRAKARLGGVTPDLIPPADAVVHFIDACASAEVAFKATAGLHHPVRAEHPLTYEPEPPRATMHGFLNVFLASSFLRRGALTHAQGVTLLDERDPSAFVFTDDAVRWRDFSMPAAELARTRESFAVAFGSCSFEEPVEDLRGLDLLPPATG